MRQPISGIHHVTAIASDPQRNLDYYTEVLGLRLVKRTAGYPKPVRKLLSEGNRDRARIRKMTRSAASRLFRERFKK